MKSLKIGWARRDITPQRPVALRGQFNLRIATRVQDPLTLTALAIENGEEQAIFVSLDSCAVDVEVRDHSRILLAELLPDVNPIKIIACGTHTHTAPFAGSSIGLQKEEEYLEELRKRYPDYMSASEYGAFVAQALAEAVSEAWENRAPGAVAWGYSYAVVGENRRVRYFDGRAVMYGNVSESDFSHIEGHVDHGVNLLFTYDEQRVLTGMIINLACPSQASEGGQDYVSADFWHDVRLEMRRRFGEHLYILPQCSAAGDQSPHRLINRRAEDRMMRLKYGEGLSNSRNLGLRQDIARRVAFAVEEAEPAVRQDMRAEAVLKHVHRQLALPPWKITDEEYALLQEQIGDVKRQLAELGDTDRLSGQYTALRSRLQWLQRAAARYEDPPASVPIEMNIVRLGDVAFVTAPFEYYLDYGDRIKGRSAAIQTFVIQLSGAGGYLPTERAASGRSYGAIPPSCEVSPEGGQRIVEEAVATIQEMFAEE